jgi:hypothetical protein
MSVVRADMRRFSFMSRSLVRLCWRSGEQTDWETEDWNVSWKARTEVRAELRGREEREGKTSPGWERGGGK